ncbi:MAG: hypothetical protein K2M82_04230, partial [Lachnospiraceae bacterium]|nr:hypothetical protein [Lachnospiraceae bacterium]
MDELWANAKARSKARFIWFLVFLWSGLILYLIANSANPFSAYDTLDCESMTVTDMKNGSSVKGMLSDVADCIASSETSSRWGNYTDSYYWVAILDNDTSIIVRTKSDTNTVSKYMSVADSFWFGMDLYHWENRRQTSGISVDGVLVPNDKEAVEFYEEWYKMSNLKSIGADFKLAPYMLDVTKTKSGKIRNFWLLLLVLVLTVLMAVYIIKKHTNSKIRSQSRAVSYATGSGNKSDTYGFNKKSSYGSTSAISGTAANGMYGSEQRSTYGSANTSASTATNGSKWDGMYGSEQRSTYGSANTSASTATNGSKWDG